MSQDAVAYRGVESASSIRRGPRPQSFSARGRGDPVIEQTCFSPLT